MPAPPSSIDVPLERKVAFLRQGAAYADHPRHVTAIQTHMSWVFLTGRHAYKLKKPVRFDFLDFRTLEARRLDSLEELRLNARLAPGVYLAVVPLTLEADGTLAIGGRGVPADWLVQMRQLPTERMLDVMIRRRSVGEGELRPALEMLCRFYRDALPAEHDTARFHERLDALIRRNRTILLVHDHRLPRCRVEQIGDELLRRLEALRPAIASRVDDGRVVEGHGDLRPEHLCLEHPPVVIDCVEFHRPFRIVDSADELAFLGMECARLGAPWVTALAFSTHESITGDAGARPLAPFYMASRAFLRSRLAFGHLADGDLPAHELALWQDRTFEYLDCAERWLRAG